MLIDNLGWANVYRIPQSQIVNPQFRAGRARGPKALRSAPADLTGFHQTTDNPGAGAIQGPGPNSKR